jgi:pentatricopeptide repeat protein
LKPDVITCNALISAMEKGWQWEKAVHTFTAILKHGVEPDAVTYSAIFEALEGNNRPQEADALFKADQPNPLSALKVMEQRQAQMGVHKPCLSGFTKQRGHDLCIDLHGLSANEARVVVRCCVGGLPASGREAAIIVGKGLGNDCGVAVVGPAVNGLLSDELGMVCNVNPDNEGVLLLTL